MKKAYLIYISICTQIVQAQKCKTEIAYVKAFYRHMEIQDIIDFNSSHKIIISIMNQLIISNNTVKLYSEYANLRLQATRIIYCYQKDIILRDIIVPKSTSMRASLVSNFLTSGIAKYAAYSVRDQNNALCISADI